MPFLPISAGCASPTARHGCVDAARSKRWMRALLVVVFSAVTSTSRRAEASGSGHD
jgi:hypothetical protein